MMFAALPLAAEIALAAVGGLVAGAYVNWATYSLAWNRRPLSPWSAPHPQAPVRRVADRVPLWGWLGLRRESKLHGAGFWVRPLLVELAMAAAWAALYWWEVGQQGLVRQQFEAIAPGVGLVAPQWTTLATFASHALLVTLMAAASLIDIDEKTIPDGVTVPGTLLALILAAAVPMSLLPHVDLRAATAAGVSVPLPAEIATGGLHVFVEPLTLSAPNPWPDSLRGAPGRIDLVVGLGCYLTWCFALTPRIWRGRRGALQTILVIMARVARELARPPLIWIMLAGVVAIAAVWYRGGPAWVGLLTALVGLIGGSAMVWAVRIVGSAALGREALGFGDVTLMMMVGAFLGWQPGIFVFFIAPFFALVVGVAQMLLRRGDVIPYGPFLCLGTAVVMIRWGDLWHFEPEPAGLQGVFGQPWLVPGMLTVCVVMLGAMLVIWRNIKEALFRHDDRSEGP